MLQAQLTRRDSKMLLYFVRLTRRLYPIQGGKAQRAGISITDLRSVRPPSYIIIIHSSSIQCIFPWETQNQSIKQWLR